MKQSFDDKFLDGVHKDTEKLLNVNNKELECYYGLQVVVFREWKKQKTKSKKPIKTNLKNFEKSLNNNFDRLKNEYKTKSLESKGWKKFEEAENSNYSIYYLLMKITKDESKNKQNNNHKKRKSLKKAGST